MLLFFCFRIFAEVGKESALVSVMAAEQKTDLLYPHDSRMTPGKALLAALQQLLAMFIGCITPALIFISTVDMEPEMERYLIGISLFTAGIGTFLQARRFGRVGSGLLAVNGTSFAYLDLLLRAGTEGGLPLACGMVLAAVPFQFVLAFFLPYLRRLFSPLVAGIVVLLIGLSLIPVAGNYIAFPINGEPLHALSNCLLAGVVVSILMITQVTGNSLLRIGGPLLAVVIGYGLTGAMGLLAMPEPVAGGWLVVPVPFKAGLAFQWELLLPFMVIYLVSSIEAIGDLSATASLSGMETRGPDFWKRVQGGIFSDAIASTLAGLLSVFPTATFSQNNGVIQLTGVGSRQVGYYVAGLLILMGLLPQTGLVFSMIPRPVLGGVTLLLFGLIAGAGLRMINQMDIGGREVMVLAVSLGLAFGISSQEVLVDSLPALLGGLFSSPVAVGGLTAVAMNYLYLRPGRQSKAEDVLTEEAEMENFAYPDEVDAK